MPKVIEVPAGMAHCGKCKLVLPKGAFHVTKKNKNGCDGYCKQCRRGYHRIKYDQKPLVIPPDGHKYCPHCDKIKPDSSFREGQLRKKQLRSLYCKECFSNIVYREPRRDDPRGGKAYGINHHSFKPLSAPISSDPVELAYAAGIFDGEGSAQIMPTIVSNPIMTVAGNNSCILEKFRSIVGGKLNYFERNEEYSDGTKARISEGRVTINTLANIAAACQAMAPYLTVKSEKCNILLAATSASPQDRLELRDKIDILNKTGVSENFNVPQSRILGGDIGVNAIPDHEYAYLAGIIDGEGWIGMKKFSTSAIQIAMTRSNAIMHIYKVFGGTMSFLAKSPPNAGVIKIRLNICDTNDCESFLGRLSNFLILKKQHCILIKNSLSSDKQTKKAAGLEMQRLTMFSKLEKFQRVKNQLAEFESRVIRDESGLITRIRDLDLGFTSGNDEVDHA